jgi:acyl transferase domain-containing protein
MRSHPDKTPVGCQKDGDQILALIRDLLSTRMDARTASTAPNGLSQQNVIRRALANGHVSPEAITYVETHGTGKNLGTYRSRGAGRSHRQGGINSQPCVLGALKANIGHLEGAAGDRGLIKNGPGPAK